MPLEIIAGAVVGVAAVSSKVRSVVKSGFTYGLAGVLIAYDKTVQAVQGVFADANELRKGTPVKEKPVQKPEKEDGVTT